MVFKPFEYLNVIRMYKHILKLVFLLIVFNITIRVVKTKSIRDPNIIWGTSVNVNSADNVKNESYTHNFENSNSFNDFIIFPGQYAPLEEETTVSGLENRYLIAVNRCAHGQLRLQLSKYAFVCVKRKDIKKFY